MTPTIAKPAVPWYAARCGCGWISPPIADPERLPDSCPNCPKGTGH